MTKAKSRREDKAAKGLGFKRKCYDEFGERSKSNMNDKYALKTFLWKNPNKENTIK